MTRKPAHIYRVPKNRSYTRKEYMKGTPAPKITIFDMGDLKHPERFELEMSLYSKEDGQITHGSLESARISANRELLKVAGETGYYLKFRLFPHEVLRENKQATGAGADRVSEGMRRSFGKAVNLGAKVKKGQKIMTANINLPHFQAAKESFRIASSKLPMPCGVSIDKGKELLKL